MRAALGLENGESLPVSTLRGRLADNRAWLADPSKPCIVVGTVDMTGSRLLFSGYGVSRGMRPVHAAMLGVDSLFVLDESHLVPAFDRLLTQIARADARLWPEREIVRPLRLLPLSATGERRECAFTLTEEDEAEGGVVARRLNAAKRLEIRTIETGGGKEGLVEPLAESAWFLAFDEDDQPRMTGRMPERAARILIYADRREIAQKVADALNKRAKAAKRGEPARARVELFTGTRRVLERETARRELADLGFLAGQRESEDLRRTPAFLVATSAAEVGVDLDADHLACDLVPLERMIQRFGRLNRLGDLAESRVVVLLDEQELRNEKDEDRRSRLQAVVQALGMLNGDASPAALIRLKKEHAELVGRAVTPPPLYPPLEPADVEAWAMTSLKEHTGRPDIQPWLRGWVDEEPQATLVWREHLPWREGMSSPQKSEVESFFHVAHPHLLEILEAPARLVADVLIKRARHWRKELEKEAAKEGKQTDPAQKPTLIALTPAGDYIHSWKLAELADEKATTLMQQIAGRLLVAARELSGLDDNGVLAKDAKTSPSTLDAGWDAEYPELVCNTIGYRVRRVSVEEKPEEGWRRAYEMVMTRDENGDPKEVLAIEVWRTGDRQQEGDPAIAARDYLLEDHLNDVAEEAATVAARLHLPENWRNILRLAGFWHDVGKNRTQWQLAASAPLNNRQRLARRLDNDVAYAKTRGPFRPALLGGYRHEFGSLVDAEKDEQMAALPEDERDLILHLVAAHHGHARPLIRAMDPLHPPSRANACAQKAALRFARLQKRFGPWGLAWLEALLRAADRKASAAITADDVESTRLEPQEASHG
ncbi:MAG: type I-U CRISPR-associated helicase/endonuclease Cas3 [Chloroflexi bacterium]|nr:MAG: type I-U CRISPR-associated helicase/endonuclease Cas3 [Chloroflexota bacterium]